MKIIGAIDGSLIPIKAPNKEEHLYVCHKGFHAINVMAVLRNLSERGGPGKLRSFWEDQVHVVVHQKEGLPVYQVTPEGRLPAVEFAGFLPEDLERRQLQQRDSDSHDNEQPAPPDTNNPQVETSATPEMAVMEEQDTDNQVIGPEVLQDQASDQESIHLSDSPRETVPSGRPVRNRRPPQVFTYSNLGSPAVNWYQANNITAYPNHGGTNFAQPYSNPSAPLYVGSPVSYPYHVGAVQ
ncbi:hypothetical protein QZH41_005656, partial [Actinostola sp. cb2023]